MHIRSRSALTLAAFTAVGMATARPAAAQYAHLTLQSQPGDYIGGGFNYDLTYTPAPGATFSVGVDPSIGQGLPNQIGFYFFPPNDPSDRVELDFGTSQLGIPLQPGTYTDAQRNAFAAPGHPGLDVSFHGRGNNSLTGSFTISAISLSPDATAFNGWRVDAFDATFVQLGQGSTGLLIGQFSYRGSGAPVPEASTTASLGLLLALGLGGFVVAARRKKVAA